MIIKRPVLTSSILLLGPTGVGKSPLGDQIEKNGFQGKRCFHFDFGHELRSIAELDVPPGGFKQKDLSFIRDVLEKGLLLENEHFHIAEKIICYFIRRNDFRKDNILILNGLPRHVAQAKDMNSIVAVHKLVVLECKPEDIFKRIEKNTGRDRTGRIDDSLEMITGKLEIFKDRTTPLIGYYARGGCDIFKIDVTATATPENIYNAFIASYAGQS